MLLQFIYRSQNIRARIVKQFLLSPVIAHYLGNVPVATTGSQPAYSAFICKRLFPGIDTMYVAQLWL